MHPILIVYNVLVNYDLKDTRNNTKLGMNDSLRERLLEMDNQIKHGSLYSSTSQSTCSSTAKDLNPETFDLHGTVQHRCHQTIIFYIEMD
jgi:hypothetical protein